MIHKFFPDENFKVGISQMPEEDYHKQHYISHSALNFFRVRGVKAFHKKFILENFTDVADQEHFGFGTAADIRIFEPDRFKQKYAIASGRIDRQKDAGLLSSTMGANPGKEILSNLDGIRIENMVQAINENSAAKELIDSPGIIQPVLHWICPETKLARKARLDKLIPQGTTQIWEAEEIHIMDAKTSRDAGPEGFPGHMGKLGYHRQAATYIQAVMSIFYKCKRIKYKFLTLQKQLDKEVEAGYPTEAITYEIGLKSICLGEQQNLTSIRELKHRLDKNTWQSRWDNQTLSIDCPGWLFNVNVEKPVDDEGEILE